MVKVELVNSQGEPAKGFELGAIEKTDKVLTYGYSRAASANGFYQIPVIATDPQNDDIALDKGSLKEAAQNIPVSYTHLTRHERPGCSKQYR